MGMDYKQESPLGIKNRWHTYAFLQCYGRCCINSPSSSQHNAELKGTHLHAIIGKARTKNKGESSLHYSKVSTSKPVERTGAVPLWNKWMVTSEQPDRMRMWFFAWHLEYLSSNLYLTEIEITLIDSLPDTKFKTGHNGRYLVTPTWREVNGYTNLDFPSLYMETLLGLKMFHSPKTWRHTIQT